MLSVDLPEIQEFDLQKIIEHKLETAQNFLRYNSAHRVDQFFVEDSALYIRCMNGFPGPLIKWMEKQMKAEGIANLVMQHPERRATAKSMIGYVNLAVQPMETRYFLGEVQGMIVQPRGKNDFGFGPIFLPDNVWKTFGEMTREEKDRYSMRGKVLRELMGYLEKI